MNVKLEICAGSIHDFENLKDLRVDRFELNSAVELGGLTPDLNTLKAARLTTNKPIIAMLRCRVGNFIYSQKELSIMYAMAQKLLENGADGLAFGFLNPDYQLDVPAIKKLKEIAKDKELVFHRAIDSIQDKDSAIETLISLNIKRILLMGLPKEGLDLCTMRIKKLEEKYGTRIELMPGGGVREDNILDIIKETKVKNIHGSFKKVIKDPKTFESYNLVDVQRVKDILKILEK